MKKISTLILALTILLSINAISNPILNSLPGSQSTLFLDFDGHYVQSSLWNGGTPFNCAASGMNTQQITEAFHRVAEDFRPFNLNVTTDSLVFLATAPNKRMRIIITTTSAWSPGVGGVAYIGSFSWGDDTPAFVFSDRLGPYSAKMVGECISHESGHTVGLSHQSKYGANCVTPIEQYNSGSATAGEIGWAPIMGNSYYRNFTNWNNGPTPYGCTNVEDNLFKIANGNGFTYRADDYGQTLNGSTTTLASTGFSLNGLISTNSDKDAFKVVLAQNRNVSISAVPFNLGNGSNGSNLDLKVEMYNGSASLIRTYDPATMNVSIDTVLNAGTYYFVLSGTGNSNISAYGSLGEYTFTGAFAPLPIRSITLNGKAEKGKHSLDWKIVADEPIKTIVVESSNDGSNFSSLTTVAPAAANFSYTAFKNSTVFYRLKVTSVINQTVYSNTIALKTTGNDDNIFQVSTLVQNEILVNAANNYQYRLLGLNGKAILSGTGLKGINKLNVSGLPSGMYIIQLFNENEIQTERIVKM